MMKSPVHPGEVLREDVLAELKLGVTEAADRLGISRVALSRVLHGPAWVSPNLAVRHEEAGVGTACSWLAMRSDRMAWRRPEVAGFGTWMSPTHSKKSGFRATRRDTPHSGRPARIEECTDDIAPRLARSAGRRWGRGRGCGWA